MKPSKRKSLKESRSLKVVVIVGPTASGKSELAVELAKKFNGEIISADSRQIYKGLDIGAGKVPGKWVTENKKRYFVYKGVIHHLINVASPLRTFTVEQYQELARRALKSIIKKGKFPIVVGGTGFYIDALIYNIKFPKVPPNLKLRKALEKKSTEELFEKLLKMDPERSAVIDPHNRRRLIRSIEIVKATGQPVSELKKESPYQILTIGVQLPSDELKRRIEARLKKRLQAGMVKEIKKLKKKLSWQRLDNLGLEYRYLAKYLKGELDRREMERILEKEIWHYAKRQLTWFRQDKRIQWIGTPKEAEKLIEQFLK